MAGSQKFTAFKLSDAELVRAFARIVSDVPHFGQASVTFQFGESGGAFNVPAAQLSTDELLQELAAADAAVLYRVSINAEGYGVSVIRGAGADEVSASFPDQNRAEIQKATATFLKSVHRHLRAYGRTAAVDEVLGRELADFYRQREELLTRLERVHTEVVEANESYRQRLEDSADAKRRELDSEYQRRLADLDSEYTRKQEDLAQREQALIARVATLDDRSSTHARRQVREDLKKIVAERTTSFKLSNDTIRKRGPVHALFLTLICVSAGLFLGAVLGKLPTPAGVPSWFGALRLPVIATALAASVVFYIRWTDHWFRQHADEEMRLKRLELDIDRATWVVEMALEWKREKGAEIPQELIDRLSQNLFEAESYGRPRHPSEDLASALLGASSGLTLNIPGLGEAKFDRKGIRQFKDALDADGG